MVVAYIRTRYVNSLVMSNLKRRPAVHSRPSFF